MAQAKLKLNIGSLAFSGHADAAWMHGNSISANAGGAG
jgi:hypothetical protein